MYSPRRFIRKYPYNRKYRYNIKDIYSPSLYGAPTPNYYQMKGRTIQVTPRNMKDVSPFMISGPKLDEMYKTLVDYKYNFPTQPLPFEIQPFRVSFSFLGSFLFSEDSKILTNEKLTNLMNRSLEIALPALYKQSTTWKFKLYSIILENQSNNYILQNFGINLIWYSNLYNNQDFLLIQKTTTEGMLNNYISPLVDAFASTSTQLKIGRLSFVSQGTVYQAYQTLNVNDMSAYLKDGNIPLMDTSAGEHDLLHSVISWEGNVYLTESIPLYFTIDVECRP